MKKCAYGLAVALLLSLGFPAYAADFVFKVAHNGNDAHPFQDGFMAMKEILEKESGGRIEVQIFPAEQLGPEDKVNTLLQQGLVAAHVTGTGAGLAPFVPESELFNLPFIFRDIGHFYRVVDGPVGQRVGKAVEEKLDVINLGWCFSGSRNAWNGKRPVMSPADLQGLKIRVMGSPILIDTFNALGAQATPMSFGEVYSALQQGVIDGAETDHVDLLVERFYEVTKHVSLTGHMYLAAAYLFSQKVYDSLPPDLQTLVWKAGTAAVKAEREAMDRKTGEALAELKAKGLLFYDVDVIPFQKAVESVYAKYADKLGGQAVLDQVAAQ